MNELKGDLPEGFKMTELGPLPEEWEVAKLGDAIEESKEKNKSNVDLKVFTVSNTEGFVPSDRFFGKRVYSKDTDNYKVVRQGYFAYNPYRINVGSIGLFKEIIGLVSPAYVVFKVKITDCLHPEYLFRLLKSPFYMSEIQRIAMSRGSVRRSLSYRDLSDFKIPLPPLPEQRKIAAVLSTVQEAKEKTEAVISAIKDFQKSMMSYLFTYGPVPLPEAENVPLKEIEVGMIPEEWKVVRLGEVCEFSRKPRNLELNDDDLIPFIPMESISKESQSIKSWEQKQYSEISSGSFVFKNDIIIAKITPSFENGKQAILDSLPMDFGYATTEIWALHPKNEQVITQHLYNYIKVHSIRMDLAKKMEGSTGRQRLPRHVLENLLIPLPPLPTQQKIASILSAIDQKIEAEEDKKKALEDLFRTLLHNLMTAKIRVNNLEVGV